jgi:mannose-6-phosphate isomerase-like protein (cupin superfamily)
MVAHLNGSDQNKGAEHIERPAAHLVDEESMLPAAQVSGQKEAIYRLEEQLLMLPQVDMPVEHVFCDGLYARTMHIPAGTCLTGAVHRYESFFVVRKGQLIVTTDNGPKLLQAGDMSVTKVGAKRAGIAVTDVEVTTFHANPSNEQEPGALWDMFTIPACEDRLEHDGQVVEVLQ